MTYYRKRAEDKLRAAIVAALILIGLIIVAAMSLNTQVDKIEGHQEENSADREVMEARILELEQANQAMWDAMTMSVEDKHQWIIVRLENKLTACIDGETVDLLGGGPL